jgi:hypothetical protein
LITTLLASSASAQYIYVANAGEDTVSKIDINTNQEVARYATWFTPGSSNNVPHLGYPWAGPAPSRLLQDSAGNLYVLDRFFNPPHLPVLLKIAPTGGTPGVTTSDSGTPASMPLPITDVDGDNHLDPGEAKDVRILWASEIGVAGPDDGALGRALCMDPSGVLWVGMYRTQRYYRVNPANGQMLSNVPVLTPGHRPYGCLVDAKGRLWSVDESKTLAEIDTATNQVTIHSHGAPTNFGYNYSLSLFNGCGSAADKVYISNRTDTGWVGKTYFTYDPQTSSFALAPLSAVATFSSVAIGVDLNGDIVSGEQSGTGRVIKTSPSGGVLWDTGVLPAGPSVPETDLHGIIIDEHNDVWAVLMYKGMLAKYSGANGKLITTVKVGDFPYTYGNPPPPTCPCARILEHPIRCEGLNNGVGSYSWSFVFTNHSPFTTPATALDISSSQVTGLTPAHFQFPNPVPVNGQATVSGTFTVANPVPGGQVCLDIRLNAGEGWCCPVERVCFRLPECPGCASLEGKFECKNGQPVLALSVTNQGPTAAQSVQIFSNTPGVTVTPQTMAQTFPQGTPVLVPLTLAGASPGQSVSLGVSLAGPLDAKTGVNSWCCSATLTVTYPKKACPATLNGWLFEDRDRDAVRDSEEAGLSGWTLTLADGRGAPRTTTSGAGGLYRFENVEEGTYRLYVQPLRGWRPSAPEAGFYAVTVAGTPERRFDFAFVKVQP